MATSPMGVAMKRNKWLISLFLFMATSLKGVAIEGITQAAIEWNSRVTSFSSIYKDDFCNYLI